MSNQQIRQLLAKLQDEIQKTELDADTRTMVQELDSDIHAMMQTDDVPADHNSVLKRAEELEASFATKHPAAERFMRELIDTLVRMGI